MSYWSRIANVFRGDRLNREIDEEMESHIREAIEQGRDPEEVKRAFGSLVRTREASRDIRLTAWLDSMRADLVFGWRQLWKSKASTSAAILSLALAMGACISAFRLIDAMLLRPLPVSDPKGLFILTYPYTDFEGKTQNGDSFDYPQFRVLRDAVKDDAELMAISEPMSYVARFESAGNSERFWQQWVSGWTFASLGLKPAAGRLLTADDDDKPGAHPVAVLSYDFWTRRFGRDPNIVGRRYRFGTDIYQIVGVCEEGFTGTDPGTVTDVFVPTMMDAKAIDNPDWTWFRTWVRPKDGVAREVVLEKLRAAVSAWRQERAREWARTMPAGAIDDYRRAKVNLEPASAGISWMQQRYRRPLAVLGVIVALVLMIACGNVANLMVARAAARAREMALRVSIGAGRWQLVQLVLLESVLIALSASVAGALLAWWSAPVVVTRINPPTNPARLILPADWRVLGFAFALALAVTLLFGLFPALRASAVKPMSTLRGGEDPRSRRRLMNALIGVQVAFCFFVNLVAGLFVATFDRLSHQPTGFAADRLLAIQTVTRNNIPSPYWEQLREQLQAVPGVESAAVCSWALISGVGWSNSVSVDGGPLANEEAYFLAVSPGWFKTMRIPLVAGQDFSANDKRPEAVIVNQAFVRRYFGDRNPIGRSFERMENNDTWRSEIIGVAADARYRNLRESIRPTVYLSFDTKAQHKDFATFMVRTTNANPLALAPVLRREVSRVRPEFAVVSIRTQAELVEQNTLRERLLAMLSLFFATVALVLAGVGLFGVLTYSVLQRRREIGIRIAIGALPAEVARRVTGEVFAMLVAGAGVGLAAGLAAERYVSSLLFDVKPTDLTVLALPALTLVAVALLAALMPVIQAVRIDPSAMLRVE